MGNLAMGEKEKKRSDHLTVYLLRHGELLHESGGRRYIGQTDLPLSPAGIRQAEQWQVFFDAVDLASVFCSDLQRSEQTARIVARGHALDVTPMVQLREVDLGAWEGLLFETVRGAQYQDYKMRGRDPAGFRPPSGESFGDLQARVVPHFEKVVAEHNGSILIVGHAGVNRVLLCHLLGMPIHHLFRIGQDYAALNVIRMDAAGIRVQAMNVLSGFPGSIIGKSVMPDLIRH